MRYKPKKYFSIVDGIIGMEGNGPVAGLAKASGIIAAGKNPLAVDVVCTQMMGFNYRKISMLFRSFDASPYALASFQPEDIRISSNISSMTGKIFDIRFPENLKFEPHFGWKEHV